MDTRARRVNKTDLTLQPEGPMPIACLPQEETRVCLGVYVGCVCVCMCVCVLWLRVGILSLCEHSPVSGEERGPLGGTAAHPTAPPRVPRPGSPRVPSCFRDRCPSNGAATCATTRVTACPEGGV